MIFFLSRATANKKASELAVGESVWLPENGELTEYFVVHKGNPDPSVYDSSVDDGVWLFRKDVSDVSIEHRKIADGASGVNAVYSARYSAKVLDAIRETTLPYYLGGDQSVTAKVHVPTNKEVDEGQASTIYGGSILDYFVGAEDADRIAYSSGVACSYIMGSYVTGTNGYTYWIVTENGRLGTATSAQPVPIRPKIILEPDTEFNNANEFVGL